MNADVRYALHTYNFCLDHEMSDEALEQQAKAIEDEGMEVVMAKVYEKPIRRSNLECSNSIWQGEWKKPLRCMSVLLVR